MLKSVYFRHLFYNPSFGSLSLEIIRSCGAVDNMSVQQAAGPRFTVDLLILGLEISTDRPHKSKHNPITSRTMYSKSSHRMKKEAPLANGEFEYRYFFHHSTESVVEKLR